MAHRGPGHVYQLRLIPPMQQDLLTTPREQITQAVATGNKASKYNREWIVGPTEEVDDVLSGRIGFQGDGGVAEIWDDEKQDFVATAVPAGLTAPFAFDLEALVLAVQPRGSLIKVQSLVVAFDTLLRDRGWRWRFEGFRSEVTFAEWKASVDKVTAVKFTIRTPNPHYHDAKNVQDLMEALHAEVTQLEARNEGGLDVESPFVKDSQAHVERGYGEAEYKGTRTEGSEVSETVYNSGIGAEEQSQEAAVDPTSGEVPTDKLRKILAESRTEVNDRERGDGGEGQAP